MKKSFILGFLTAALLLSALPIGAAVQEYILKPSTAKLVVDGVEVKDEKLPVLYLEPGYNYIPAATFRAICDKIEVGFQYDDKASTIKIDTKVEKSEAGETVKEGNSMSETIEYLSSISNLTKSGDEETFVSDGVKYITGPSLNTILYKSKFKLVANLNGSSIQVLETGLLVLDNIPLRLYKDNKDNERACFEYDYYLNTILPLIK